MGLPRRVVHLACLEEWHASEGRWSLVCGICKQEYEPGPVHLRLALKLWERVRDREAEDFDRLYVADELARGHAGMGNFSEAAKIYRETLPVWRRLVGPEHPATLRSVKNLGLLLEKRGKVAEAEPLLRRARGVDAAAEQAPAATS